MKKFILLSIILLLTSFSLVAQEFSYDLMYPQIRHARIDALAGTQITDTSWYYGFLSNPANIGLMDGKKSLISGITLGLGGPIKHLGIIIDAIVNKDEDSLIALSQVMSENKGLDMDLVISGPLQFGSVKNNFGWGFFNQTYLIANIPSINYLEAYAGNESLLRLGIALPIPLLIGKISIGGAVDLVNRVEGKLASSLVSLLGDTDFNLIIPLYTSFGFAADLGLNVKLLNFISLGLVWDDAVIGYFTSKSPNLMEGDFDPTDSYNDLRFGRKVNFGASVSVPLINALTLGIITSLDFMLDVNDMIGMIKNAPEDPNPILNVSLGAEAVFQKTISLRLGLHEMYPSMGIGAKFGSFNLDFAIFGRELGLEPGARPQLNLSLSLEFLK